MADNTEIPPDGEPRSLAQSINTAIASSHTKINRLILDRMPHAVPPQADNPSTYVTGLLHIGAVYIAFESLWQNIIGVHTEIAPLPYTYPFRNDSNTSSPGLNHGSAPPQVAERVQNILETAYWPNMLRATRVKADIRTMTGWPAHVVDEQIRSAGTTGALGAFLAHIKEAVDGKPHLLLAYAYSLYMALLSGGSYIRTELMYLRAEFWLAVPDPVRPDMVPCTRELDGEPEKLRRHSTFECDSGSHGLVGEDPSITLPLSFLDFDTPLSHENPRQQAKDLKAEFKLRFANSEQALTDPERRDITAESVAIFEHLEAVVGQLDKICGSGAGVTRQGKSMRHSTKADPRPAGIGSRLRDSIAIAKGRLLRTMKRSSGADGSITATAPSAVRTAATSTDNTTAYPPEKPENSKVSSGSSGGLPESAQGGEPDGHLARYAIVPGEGFRTIRYGDDDIQPDAEDKVARREVGGYDGTADDDQASVGREYQACPVSRSPTLPAKQSPGASTSMMRSTGRGPEYALYAVVSNVAVLFGVAMVFAAYLYVRRCDITTTMFPAGFTGRCW
ncbi:putative hem oxygenasemulti-helical [Diaporthe ampelina]|uniref:Putative hem oxygenasemulti-helical n=1 Tax=Diaporthe ampelina TaxID=1214573 RepID=A0A0G2FR31_9PEZI|nr:putative hem oxygenasemulti-helical [Diaporthe ampelina]